MIARAGDCHRQTVNGMFYVTSLYRFSSDLGVQGTAVDTMSVQVVMNIPLILKRYGFKTYLGRAVRGSNAFSKDHKDCFSVRQPGMTLKKRVQRSLPDIACRTDSSHTRCALLYFLTCSLMTVKIFIPRRECGGESQMQGQRGDSEKCLEYQNSDPSTHMLGQTGRLACL